MLKHATHLFLPPRRACSTSSTSQPLKQCQTGEMRWGWVMMMPLPRECVWIDAVAASTPVTSV